MNRHTAIKYFNKQWKVMNTRLKSYLKSGDQEDLHQFRVQVKKIEAFLILSGMAAHPAKLQQLFKPVKKIFKRAGVLRNSFIKNELTHRRQPVNKEGRNFCQYAGEKLQKIKKARRILKQIIKPVPTKNVRWFYKNELKGITGAFALSPSARQLHECRKRIKVLLYNEHLVHDVLKIGVNTTYLDEVQEAIGNWHDQLLAHQSECHNGQTGDSYPGQKEFIATLTDKFYQRATVQK
ncbi:CHAD domain-containing protein [Mucilaginibacter rigui]|uniref:CHAD domain-containing protein n=1 Tax=Mucilaginibacter rigui TaxID=534635 RepID=A0ABR7X9P9_9SPHI|nr:CHAD domain-containing protein [Mucilaginibacter rigui]MBD1386552.1 CHAD domain-containing protein [Mucilaginibacter rigui]